MIAYTGRVMLEHGISTPLASSHVNPSFRVDQVDVAWRSDETTSSIPVYGTGRTTAIGAEAVVTIGRHEVRKERRGKCYRSPDLDRQLIRERTRMEARLISMARRAGVPTPVISDITEDSIRMEKIEGPMLKECLGQDLVREAGGMIGRLHQAGIIHGDLTTSNILVRDGRCVLIDFGLAQVSPEVEPRGVDIHVFFQTLESMVEDHAVLRQCFIEGYQRNLTTLQRLLPGNRKSCREGGIYETACRYQ